MIHVAVRMIHSARRAWRFLAETFDAASFHIVSSYIASSYIVSFRAASLGVASCAGLLGLSLTACGGAHDVPRRNGELIELGRHIPPQAYAWYARGLYFERGGHLREAELAYQAAIDFDPKSGTAWASLVRVRCQTGDERALEAAEKGLARALRLAPIQSERARCLLSTWRHRLPDKSATSLVIRALDDARAAVSHEPSSPSANQLVVEIYQALSEDAQATTWQRAFELFTGYPLVVEEPRLPSVDELLVQGDLEAARKMAVSQISPGELAMRAYALNRSQLAQQQAEMTLRASPHDPDAQLVVYLTADEPVSYLEEQLTFEVSPLSVIVFTAHLKRTAGKAAALEFWQRYSPALQTTGDSLAELLAENLALE